MHAGHTSAVIDVDYSPTGQEFATGSYDKSVRIFETTKVILFVVAFFLVLKFCMV